MVSKKVKPKRRKAKRPELPSPPDHLEKRMANLIADLDCILNIDGVCKKTEYVRMLTHYKDGRAPRVTTLIAYATRWDVELTISDDTYVARLVDEDMLRDWLRRAQRQLAEKYPRYLVAALESLDVRHSFKNWFGGKMCSPRLDVFLTVALDLGYHVYWWAPWWSVGARAHAFETALTVRGVTPDMRG